MCPFQCDLCVFRNLQRCDPVQGSETDKYLLQSIRRVNLDALWDREAGTVSGNLSKIVDTVRLAEELGLRQPPLSPIGPYPVEDVFGHGTALVMVRLSQEAGRNDRRYKQFGTIRKLRTAAMNQWGVTVPAAGFGASLLAEKKTTRVVSMCPTQSDWFRRFSNGCRDRMGEKSVVNKAISREIMHAVMNECEQRVTRQRGAEQSLTISVATYLVVSFCASLRGPEGFMMCLGGLRDNLFRGKSGDRNAHVVVPLQGRFKGENGERYHLLPIPAVTETGFAPRKWLERLVYIREQEGITNGPAFCGKGKLEVARMGDYEEVFFDLLETVMEDQPGLFDKDCSIRDWYGLFRSLRRGSTSLATSLKVPKEILDLMNRWNKVEQARGKRVNLPMHEHYTDIEFLVTLYLDYCQKF